MVYRLHILCPPGNTEGKRNHKKGIIKEEAIFPEILSIKFFLQVDAIWCSENIV